MGSYRNCEFTFQEYPKVKKVKVPKPKMPGFRKGLPALSPDFIKDTLRKKRKKKGGM